MTEAQIKTDTFLDLYKEIEERLKERGIKNGRSSVVMQFMASPEGRAFKDDLNVCREMRNILTHCPDIDGEPPLIPTDAAIETLRRVEAYLSAPPRALDRAAKGEGLVSAKLSDKVMPLMEKMVNMGFSHIPVFENGKLFGVFSISSVFSKAMKYDGDMVSEDTLVRDFIDYIPIEKHVCERFVFAPKETTVIEAKEMFDNFPGPTQKRVAAIFITENGSPTERILGMLTPWDVLCE